MKNKIKFFGIIAFVVIIGFSMTACDDGGDDDGSITIGDFTFIVFGDRNEGGNSTISMSRNGNNITVTGNLTKDCDGGTWGQAIFQIRPNVTRLNQIRTSSSFASFDIIGDGKDYYFLVLTNSVMDYGFHRARFSTTNGVQTRKTIFWNELWQPNWATPVEASTNNITMFEISIHTEVRDVGPFSFTFVME